MQLDPTFPDIIKVNDSCLCVDDVLVFGLSKHAFDRLVRRKLDAGVVTLTFQPFLPFTEMFFDRDSQILTSPPQISIPVFVLNLDRRKDRYAFVNEKCHAAGITCIQKSAVDGQSHQFSEHERWLLRNTQYDASGDKKGAAACALSHREFWLQVANGESGSGAGAIILEDDNAPAPAFRDLLSEVVAKLPPDYDLVYLGTETIYLIPEVSKYFHPFIGRVHLLISHSACSSYHKRL